MRGEKSVSVDRMRGCFKLGGETEATSAPTCQLKEDDKGEGVALASAGSLTFSNPEFLAMESHTLQASPVRIMIRCGADG